MRIRHNEIEINNANPFSSCRLDREKYAQVLSGIVAAYPEGFVLAINNEWGTGKTTFVRMWKQLLENDQYKTVYFNAWENDFEKEPLTALLAELKPLTTSTTQKVYKSVVQKGSAIAKAVLPTALKTASKGFIDIDGASTAVENLTKAATEAFDKEIKEYLKKKDSIKEFRKQLEEFVTKAGGEKPIVFIVDELDRCRPDYAVEVLEQMKHFFSVPGIAFVLSIDKNHLAAAVRGYYGSEQINTDEYLRRFIDVEYSIPKPSAEQFSKYLYDYFQFDSFFQVPQRTQHGAFQNDRANFIRMANLLFDSSNSTLRQIEKIFGVTRLILRSFKSNQYALPEALLVLSFWSVKNRDFYSKLRTGNVTLVELGNEFGSIATQEARLKWFLLTVEARLLVLMHNENENGKSLIEEGNDGNISTDLKSSFEKPDSGDLAKAISHIYSNRDTSHTKLSYLTNKIDLAEPIAFE